MIYIDNVYINDVQEVKFSEDQTPLTGYRARAGGQVSQFSALSVVISFLISVKLGLPRRLSDKESACQAGRGFSPWAAKVPWRRKWQPTPVCLPGKPHGQRSLGGYSPWGHNSQTGLSTLRQHSPS